MYIAISKSNVTPSPTSVAKMNSPPSFDGRGFGPKCVKEHAARARLPLMPFIRRAELRSEDADTRTDARDSGMREAGKKKEGTGHSKAARKGRERRKQGFVAEITLPSLRRGAALPQVAVGRPVFRTRAAARSPSASARAPAARRRPGSRRRRSGSGCRMQLEVAFRSFASSRSSPVRPSQTSFFLLFHDTMGARSHRPPRKSSVGTTE